MDKDKTYPEGHFVGMWMGICIAMFSGFGIPISIATGNFGFIGIGPALGVAVGTGIGKSMENKYKQQGKIRPLTESERKRKKNAVTTGIILLIVGVLAFIVLLLL